MAPEPNTPAAVENRPTPLGSLQQDAISSAAHFRRDHFTPPAVAPEVWELSVGGAVRVALRLSLDDLRELEPRTLGVVLECAGHRRSEYEPAVPGLQWGVGALAEASWTGVPLAVVLDRARVRADAVEVVVTGADRGPFEELVDVPFARSVPLSKARHEDTILAYAMNGEPIPRGHGGPVRLVVPGWYATDSIKWIVEVEPVTEPFQGPFQARDYRFRAAGDPTSGHRLADLPVHALVTTPGASDSVAAGAVELRGIAWGGHGGIERVEVQVDDGAWRQAAVRGGHAGYGRAFWGLDVELASGEHDIGVRATDGMGTSQPERAEWNQGGFVNNGVHRVRVTAG